MGQALGANYKNEILAAITEPTSGGRRREGATDKLTGD